MSVKFSLVNDLCCGVFSQAHRGIKGIVKDEEGNVIKGARITVKGIRHDIMTSNNYHLLSRFTIFYRLMLVFIFVV